MQNFLLAGTAALAIVSFLLVGVGSQRLGRVLGAQQVDMTAGFDTFHRSMVVAACVVLCGIPVLLVNILTDGDPLSDRLAMCGLYSLLLYFVLNIFNRKIILTSSGIVTRTALGKVLAVSNQEFLGARMDKRMKRIGAVCFVTPRHRVIIDEQMENYHMVVAELQRRAG
ncbi:hypothetical protein [Massilia sp. H6]|uniref:hypothetical protein n=1 Tax=Massilia sp. H6 TaxID=2970464 RepID=UPI00216942F8|nr:hypothetical protein [Massilia sp. H6]UVW28522.1 hypothetical protein NRS07_18730 [Massilia sp. H6]